MIRASEASRKILEAHAEAVRRAEGAIDEAILKSQDARSVVATVPDCLHRVVCDRLVEVYRDGGWIVTFDVHQQQDQRDDNYTTFTLAATVGTDDAAQGAR